MSMRLVSAGGGKPHAEMAAENSSGLHVASPVAYGREIKSRPEKEFVCWLGKEGEGGRGC